MRITAIMHQVNVPIEILISRYIQSIATSDLKNANNIVFRQPKINLTAIILGSKLYFRSK